MPPSQKRARRYDHARTRTAVLAQFGHVRSAVAGLTPDQLARPTRLGDWTVRELAAHLAMAVESVSRCLDRPAPERQEVTLLDWPFATAQVAGQISEDVRALAATTTPDELFRRTADRITERLPAAAEDRLIASRVGAMRLGDYLVTRCVELVVHTDDLNAATGLEIPYDRQALAACTRLLADALAVKAPGASTEVRIPPYAVVQCIEGPRHTRGTPPNVVETDPLSWIRLATGRTRWRAAVDEALVAASGERADLSDLLPVMG
ncbi:maleylpyruvate isomerase family mycothiol-dependent enzyme [Streptomyces sp. A 4/2]|uniref:maleylpyruvate isomerase family mycothiol-dependent enzyme n=1 Tax=Streptomyces sp. A 4/2 TaxID=2934314 RepID=UPI002024A6F7|nr:maleylpyruvate isomerase family mycothiol-dependent enzyme [Streptomyces sp. A 4/2]